MTCAENEMFLGGGGGAPAVTVAVAIVTEAPSIGDCAICIGTVASSWNSELSGTSVIVKLAPLVETVASGSPSAETVAAPLTGLLDRKSTTEPVTVFAPPSGGSPPPPPFAPDDVQAARHRAS